MRVNLLPDWLLDADLKNGDRDTLTFAEYKFWNDLIDKYLKPLDLTEKDKEEIAGALINLRDMVIMAFIMINALFVLVMFLLQIHKEQLHIKWPFGATNRITYNDALQEVLIVREYLELEPIGLLFVAFFGVVLAVQFVSMLKHRFGTVSEILVSTKLDWYCAKRPDQMSAESDLKGQAVMIARKAQRPERLWDEDNLTEEQVRVAQKRNTVHKLMLQHKNKQDWSNLEVNFKRRFLKDGALDLGRFTVRRETMNLLNSKRVSMIEDRRIRKSMQMSYGSGDGGGGDNGVGVGVGGGNKAIQGNSTNSGRTLRLMGQQGALLISHDNDEDGDNGIRESNVDEILNLDKHNSTSIWAQHQSNSINYLTNRYHPGGSGGGGGVVPDESSHSWQPPTPPSLLRSSKAGEGGNGGIDNQSFVPDEIFGPSPSRPAAPAIATTTGRSSIAAHRNRRGGEAAQSNSSGSNNPTPIYRRKSEKNVTFTPDHFFD